MKITVDMNHRYEVRCDQQRSEKGAQASAETREVNPPDDSADVVVKVYVPGQKKLRGLHLTLGEGKLCNIHQLTCLGLGVLSSRQ